MARHPGTQVLIVSEGTSAQVFEGDAGGVGPMSYTGRLAEKRRCTRVALGRLNATLVAEGTFVDQRLERSRLEICRWIEGHLRVVRPAVVLTHNPTDLNLDHRIVAEAVAVAVRPYTEAGRGIRTVLGFHVDPWPAPSLLAPAPTVFLSLVPWELDGKLAACAAYQSEMRPSPHPRSLDAIRAHAHLIGHWVGVEAAEPYTLYWGRW